MIALTKKAGSSQLNSIPIRLDVLCKLSDTTGLMDGSEAHPWTHPDGTAGLQTAHDMCLNAGGGSVFANVGKYLRSKAAWFVCASMELYGVAGFARDPNASQLPTSGTRFLGPGTCMQIGIGGGTERVGGGHIHDIFIGGTSATYGPTNPTAIGMEITGCLDQWLIYNVHFGRLYDCIKLTNTNVSGASGAATGSNMDTCTIERCNALYCYNGIRNFSKYPSYFVKIKNNCLSDLEGPGIFWDMGLSEDLQISENILARCGAGGGPTIMIAGSAHVISLNLCYTPGLRLINDDFGSAGTWANAADCIEIKGNFCKVSENDITGVNRGAGVKITAGAGNQINGNNYYSTNRTSDRNYSANSVDINIASGVIDTSVLQPLPYTITDNGTRTLQNLFGVNNGDPDIKGDWFGVNKGTGTSIFDKTPGVNTTWLYHPAFGRTSVAINPSATSSGSATPDPTYPIANPNLNYIQVERAGGVEDDNALISYTNANHNFNPNKDVFIGNGAQLTSDDTLICKTPYQCAGTLHIEPWIAEVQDFVISQYSIDFGKNWIDVNQKSTSSYIRSYKRPAITFPKVASQLYEYWTRKAPNQASGAQVCVADHIDAYVTA